jgi:hypothetical protein
MNFVPHAKHRRVQVAQQPVQHGRFGLDDSFQLANVDLFPRYRRQHSQIVELVGGNLAGLEDFRAAEEISLEIVEPGFQGRFELLPGFDFLRQHPATRISIALHQFHALRGCGSLEVDLDEIHGTCHRGAGIIGDEVIEGNAVPGRSQSLAGRLTRSSGATVSSTSTTVCSAGRSVIPSFSSRSRAIDECFLTVAQNVKAHQKRGVESAACRRLAVGGSEEILNAIPK